MTPRSASACALAALLGTLAVSVPAAGSAEPPDVVSARLIRESRAVVVEAKIEPGWHVNAHRPRDGST